jgi:hypothetical protein
MADPTSLNCTYQSLVNDIGFDCFGLVATTTDVITESKTSTTQTAQIHRAIRKGLQFVYGAYRWSFLRPKLSINTNATYSTGTITISSVGSVELDGGVVPDDGGFPTYSVTDGGMLYVQTAVPPTFYGGSWLVGTRTSSTVLVLTDYAASGAPEFATAIPYSLVFNRYPFPTGYDSFDGEISFTPGWGQQSTSIRRVDPVELRRRLQIDTTAGKPEMYALFTETFSPTVGSSRYFSFYPIPDQAYQLEAIGTWMPAMLDADNLYPLGGTLLSAVITEACLAAAERDIKNIDEGHPDAVHCRAMVPALQMAIQRDREYGAPDSLGVDRGGRQFDDRTQRRNTSSTYWYGGGFVGYVP